jgi:DICT domain-containing protein
MVGDLAPSLTTAQLADRAGLSAGTLRMWQRLPGGHHRYTPRDVETVREVLRLREQGLSITAAIARAESIQVPRPASIFAGLRAARPDLQPVTMGKRALLDMSWAIEDEYCARAGAGLLIASFQRAVHYRQSQRRWRELARTADLACVLADFDTLRMPEGEPIEVPFDRGNPMAREWTLVIDAPGARACLAAWEQPAASELPDRERRFEVIWSFEPEVVRIARTIACGLVGDLAPVLADRLPGPSDAPVPGSPPELRFATGLAQRMVGYLAARV